MKGEMFTEYARTSVSFEVGAGKQHTQDVTRPPGGQIIQYSGDTKVRETTGMAL